jgi:hypothetical protein
MIFKNLITASALALLALLSNNAMAQTTDVGPFASREALLAHYRGETGTPRSCGYIKLEGQTIVSRLCGFGPYRSHDYYVCANGLIYKGCAPNGPFGYSFEVANYWRAATLNQPTSIYVYVDGQLVFSKLDGFGPARSIFYTYCQNRKGYMTNCSL